MGRPAKIRKKKSFMFTTKHYSFMSILGTAIGVLCLAVAVMMLIFSYRKAGTVETGLGGVGLFSAFLNVIGILCGISSLQERDTYIAPAVVAIAVNAVLVTAWAVMIIIAVIAT